MYQYTPSDIDRTRADYQAKQQGADDVDSKRVGNLGEVAFEQFCREYLPTEMWEWQNEDAIRRCNRVSVTCFGGCRSSYPNSRDGQRRVSPDRRGYYPAPNWRRG
nr:hypothetical protein [Halomicrobium urmianum]